ncbi:MAG TPA: alpha-E domain-containing protein, partial [Tepidisphaeraceae bacterium]|nr:alpha-E domain-containing protein [Tepidisphaeraceae bacterium]
SMLNQPARPMLARDADSIYWMSRYVERAEHVARLLLVNSTLLVDVGDMAARMQSQLWQSIRVIFRQDELPETGGEGPIAQRVLRSLTFDLENPNSLISCVGRARENARGIRENISAEMWECLNTLYWAVRGDEAPAKYDDSPDDFYRSIMAASMLFQGLTDQTMAHDQRWQFTQLAKYFERADVTCRVIQTKFNILSANETMTESAIRNIHWMAVLRSCCSIEAYRRTYLGDMDPLKVAGFLLLEKNFPRSVRFSVEGSLRAMTQIRTAVNPRQLDEAERILGRLDAQLEYAELGEILMEGLSQYLERIQSAVADAALAVQKRYFLH